MHHQSQLIRESKSVFNEGSVFSIFIPTWNNLPYLKLCVDSLRKNSTHIHQVIVHVNEGIDGTIEWVKAQPDLSYTISSINIGVCYALNQCRTIAESDYFLYLNDDMYVCPGWDKELFDEIKSIGHNEFYLSATAIEPLETGNACVIVKNYGEDPASFQEKSLLDHFNEPEKSDWQGATWPPNIVHKKVWDLVGGYSIEFSPGLYSDPDFSMKLWNAGIRLFKGITSSRVYHFGGKSTARMVRNRGYYTFIAKWGMTAGMFTRKILRSGHKFEGSITSSADDFSSGIKTRFKRVQAALKSL
jgi:glycosyltransferase involved in cell wall biosynthesis